jgi:8-amino-7-oxononanoate synthase
VIGVDMGDPGKATAFWNALLDEGVYVNLAIPPGTPNSTSLLRCSVSAAHSADQIDHIIKSFAAVGAKLAPPDAAE